jgi:hypothetical protein
MLGSLIKVYAFVNQQAIQEGQSVLIFCAAKINVENCARLVAACLAATAAAALRNTVYITTAATATTAADDSTGTAVTAATGTSAAGTATVTAAVQRAALIAELRETTVGLCPILKELIPHGKY